MAKVAVILFLLFIINAVSLQGTGSGNNGKLRLCVVEGRGSYKRTLKYCPVLDKEDSGVECVIGTDRLDCLRRITKGTVDFSALDPEDLVAAQWANVDVLVTHEMRSRDRPFERSVVAVVRRDVVPDGPTTLRAMLRNRTLCHPGTDVDDLRPFSSTLAGYLENLVLPKACEPELTLAENRIKALADFFGHSCKAGPWVVDKIRDAELKRHYSSLCSACGSPTCSTQDRYWGDLGSLACLVEVGEVAWGELDDVKAYFGLKSTNGKTQYPSPEHYSLLCRDGSARPLNASDACVWLHRPWPVIVAKSKTQYPSPDHYSLLCRDGSARPLNASDACVWLHRPWPVIVAKSKTQYPSPEHYSLLCRDGSARPLNASDACVWLHRPWPVIMAKRKAAVAVGTLLSNLSSASTTDAHWRGALTALLGLRTASALAPPQPAADYLARARGFREAYSQQGCNPPRHITVCTTTALEHNKCEWLSEAGAVYGVAPPLQCTLRAGAEACARAVAEADASVMVADSDWLIRAQRDYNLTALLHEATPIVEKTHTVVAYVRPNSDITKLSDLRGKRAMFPSYDGVAWHSVLRYLARTEQIGCKDVRSFFSEICAPGFEKSVQDKSEGMLKNCYVEEGGVVGGEEQALRGLVEGRADVAFFSMDTYNKYTAKVLPYAWASTPMALKPVCPEDNSQYCFISWASVGHVFAKNDHSAMRNQEIINVFTKLDQLFGKYHPFHSAMFSMYGPYNHKTDVLFHNSTKNLISSGILDTHPYNKIPMNFERSLSNSTDSCHAEDFTSFGAKVQPTFLVLLVTLVVYLVR